MQTKLAAVLVREVAGNRPVPVTVICRELGISRQTYYKLRRRFAEDGVDGLMPRSRRPHHSPRQLSAAEEGAVVAAFKWLQDEGWDYGAISIHARLTAQAVTGLGDSEPDQLDSEPTVVALNRVASLRTIHRVLHRRGLAPPEPNKRTRASGRRFEFPASNDCWQIDAFEHRLATGEVVVVFELLDDHSRLLLANLAWPSEDGAGAWTVVAAGIAVFGPPRMFLSDNSLAFSGARRGRQVQFETNLCALGIKPITSRPYHPRTCGKNERHHQTSQRWLRRRPAAETLEQLQTQLDTYLEAYNTKRPHQGIGMATPAARYHSGQRNRPDTSEPRHQRQRQRQRDGVHDLHRPHRQRPRPNPPRRHRHRTRQPMDRLQSHRIPHQQPRPGLPPRRPRPRTHHRPHPQLPTHRTTPRRTPPHPTHRYDQLTQRVTDVLTRNCQRCPYA